MMLPLLLTLVLPLVLPLFLPTVPRPQDSVPSRPRQKSIQDGSGLWSPDPWGNGGIGSPQRSH